MASVVADVLPSELLMRETKASFDEAFWGAESRSLAERWAGEGADPQLVEAASLRREWTRPLPDPHTFTLLQAAWLEVEGRREDRSRAVRRVP